MKNSHPRADKAHPSSSRPQLMAHCVVFFPDEDKSLAVARGLAKGGAAYLEVQFPFSDPTADGPAIQSACQRALEQDFTVDRGFSWIEKLAGEVSIPIFLMSYANLPFRRGVERFCREASKAGAEGLIIPDLLPSADEGLYRACRKHGLAAVPVISPNITDLRLHQITADGPSYLYTTLRAGITGTRTEINESHIAHLKRCAKTGAQVLAGFGIESPEQVEALAPYADTLVAGSFFVKKIIHRGLDTAAAEIETNMTEAVEYLLGG